MKAPGLSNLPLAVLTTKIGSGATPRGGKNAYAEQGTPLVRSMNVQDLVFDRDGLAFIDDKQARQLDGATISEGDVLLNITGASVARCCIAPHEMAGGRVNQHVAIIRPKPDVLNGRFLSYLLVSPTYKGQLLSLASVGATREALTKGGLERLQVAIPPIDAQHRIACILGAYDDLIEANKRRAALLEEMAWGLFEEWFVRFRFPGHENAQMREVAGVSLPTGWIIQSVGEVASYVGRGVAPRYDDGATTLVVGQKCIRDNRLSLRFARSQSKVPGAEKVVQEGDVLINSTGVGTLGRVAQAEAVPPGLTVDSHVTIVRPSLPFDRDYLGMLLLRLQPIFEHLGAGSTGQTELSRGAVAAQPLTWAPVELRQHFGRIVRPMRLQVSTLMKCNEALTASRNLLLPRLISGKLSVDAAECELEEAA